MANGYDASGDGRKIFVGGLSWETTEADLREYFSKYGGVSECTLKTDPNTGRSRGFGFVLFEDSGSVDNVLAETGGHSLNGKNIDPKRAMARGAVAGGGGGGGGGGAVKKVFVGGVDPNTTESTLRSHFDRFGTIEEVALPYDKMKGMRKGFVFITFQSTDSVDLVCQESKHSVDGKDVEVKKATPKNDGQRGGGRGGGFGGRGGRGGGYGQYGGRGGGGGYGSYNQSGWGNQSGYGGGDYNGYGSTDYSSGAAYGAGYGSQGGYNQGGYGGYSQGSYGGAGYTGDSYSGGYKQRQDGGSYGYHPYQR